MTGTESLLCRIFNCGELDLKLLDDVKYNWGDVLDQMDFPQEGLDFNDLLRGIFAVGLLEIEEARNDRIAELEAVENERELDDDERQELVALRQLDINSDFDCYCNCIDTQVYCSHHAAAYKEYLKPAWDAFEDNTGFEINYAEL